MWLSITFFLFPLSSLSLLLLLLFFFLRNILSALWHSTFTSFFFFSCLLQCWFFLELFPLLFSCCCCLSSSLFCCCLEGAIYVYAMGIKRGDVRGKKKVEIINTRTFCLLSLVLSLYIFFFTLYHNSKAYMWPHHPPRTKKNFFFIKKTLIFVFCFLGENREKINHIFTIARKH